MIIFTKNSILRCKDTISTNEGIIVAKDREYLVYDVDTMNRPVIMTDMGELKHIEGNENNFELVAFHEISSGRVELENIIIH